MRTDTRTKADWSEIATSLPGTPDCWAFMVGAEAREAPFAFTSDGARWVPSNDGLFILDIDHPATEGVLCSLLGASIAVKRHYGLCIVSGWHMASDGWSNLQKESTQASVGRACVAVAELMNGWPGMYAGSNRYFKTTE